MPDDTKQPDVSGQPANAGQVAEHDEDVHKVDPEFGSAFDDAGSKPDDRRRTTPLREAATAGQADDGSRSAQGATQDTRQTADDSPDKKDDGADKDKKAEDKKTPDASGKTDDGSQTTDGGAEKKTAAERLEARAAEKESGGQADDGRQTPDAGPGKTDDGRQTTDASPEKKTGQAGATPAALQVIMGDLAKVPGLMDAKIGVDGKEVALKDFLTEYPEVGQSAVLIGQAMAQQAVQNLIQSGQVVTPDALQKMNTALANMEFWQGVQEAHPDGRKIAASPEFRTWLSKQSKMVQTMGSSVDKQDGIVIIDAYKEHLAKAAKEVKTGQETDKKTKRDDLHKETLRGRQGADTTGGDKGKDDFAAGFSAAGGSA
jgi:hypothetical protein